MSEYVTDEEYKPEYWKEFTEKQRIFKKKIMSLANEAGNTTNLVWLKNQIVFIGVEQAQLKQWLMKHITEVPKWQRREMLYVIDMYHDLLVEIDKIHKKRERGQ